MPAFFCIKITVVTPDDSVFKWVGFQHGGEVGSDRFDDLFLPLHAPDHVGLAKITGEGKMLQLNTLLAELHTDA